MAENSRSGRFVWYELVTTDPEAAQSFYSDVIGWSTAPFEGTEMPYTMWVVGDDPIGGVMQMPPEAGEQDVPPHWIAYVGVDDVDATSRKAGELGATIVVEPRDIPDVGRFAILHDPQGATIAIYKSVQERAANGEPRVGDFSWHELATTDHEAAFDFYEQLFGWKKTEAMDMGEMGIYQMYGAGDRTLGGMFDKPSEMPGPPAWLYYTLVDDLDGVVEKVREKGGQVLNGPMEVPGGDRIAQCMDPQGAMFAIHAKAGS